MKNCPAVSYSMPTLDGFPFSETDKVLTERSDPEEIERQAFEKGFAEGEKTGIESGEKKAAVFLRQLETLCSEIHSLKERLMSEFESQIVLLASEMAKRIIKKELMSSSEIIETLVQEALKKLDPIGPITIKLNPFLFERLNQKKKEFQEVFPDLLFEKDNKAPENGVVVSSPFQEIDTDLDFQLSNIIEELRSRIKNA